MKIEWLDTSREDMFALYAWHSKESRRGAIKIYNGLIADVERIATNPGIGHIEPLLEGLEYEFRTIVAKSKNHKIIYFTDENTIFVYRIWDCRQSPSKLRRGFLKKKP